MVVTPVATGCVAQSFFFDGRFNMNNMAMFSDVLMHSFVVCRKGYLTRRKESQAFKAACFKIIMRQLHISGFHGAYP